MHNDYFHNETIYHGSFVAAFPICSGAAACYRLPRHPFAASTPIDGCNRSHNQVVTYARRFGFLHTHKTHEELYFILKGEGQYQVDGNIFPVSEGSIVRVSHAGKRALKNTGKDEMLMLCVQYKANSFTKSDDINEDGTILNDKLAW